MTIIMSNAPSNDLVHISFVGKKNVLIMPLCEIMDGEIMTVDDDNVSLRPYNSHFKEIDDSEITSYTREQFLKIIERELEMTKVDSVKIQRQGKTDLE